MRNSPSGKNKYQPSNFTAVCRLSSVTAIDVINPFGICGVSMQEDCLEGIQSFLGQTLTLASINHLKKWDFCRIMFHYLNKRERNHMVIVLAILLQNENLWLLKINVL